MSETDTGSHVDKIKQWLASYRQDVERVKAAMLSDAPSPRARYTLAGVLNYQLRKMDLTPDWTPEIGMIDDAMVLRTGASVFKGNNLLELPPDVAQTIDELAGDDEAVKAMLGEDLHDRLFLHIRGLLERRIHGRTPEEIVDDAEIRARFVGEIDRYAAGYKVAEIGDGADLVHKVRSYIEDKLD